MKEGWEYKKLGEVCSFMSGYTPKKEELNNKSGVPYFKVSDMNRDENGYEMNRTELFVKRPKKIFPVGAIIFPKNGGAIFTEKKRFLVCDSIIDLNTEAILANESFLKKEYLFYLLTKIKISTFDNGGGLPSVNIKKMCDYEICIPPLPEQQSIVDYLDSAFAKIDALKANAEKALNEAKALFQASLKEMLEPKEGWEEVELKNLCKKTYNIRWDNVTDDKSYMYIDLTSVNRESLKITDPRRIVKSNAPSRAKQIVLTGDVIFATTRPTLRRLCEIVEQYNEQLCSTGYCVLRPRENVISRWIFYCLQSDDFYSYIEPLQTGANYPAVTDGIVKEYKIPVPTLSEQQSIVATLDSLKSKVDRLQENFEKISQECDALKQAILKQVFE